jgi:hypothetical protein
LFLFCRKACGLQQEWRESIESIHRKSASTAELRKFKADLKKIVAKGSILDYELSFGADGQMLIIRRMKNYLLNAEQKKSRATASEAIKKSRDILKKRDVQDVELK